MFFQQALLLFVLLEALTLFYIIGEIGFFETFVLLVCVAIGGAVLIHRQGLAMLSNVHYMLQRQAVPVDNFFGGMCAVIAGLLLILPGFISDILAILLLIPAVRGFLKNRNIIRTYASPKPSDDIIDGSYVRVEEEVEQIVQKPSDHNQT